MDCTQNRKFDQHHIPDKLPEEAWAILKKASDEKDLEDFRDVGPLCTYLSFIITDILGP